MYLLRINSESALVLGIINSLNVVFLLRINSKSACVLYRKNELLEPIILVLVRINSPTKIGSLVDVT